MVVSIRWRLVGLLLPVAIFFAGFATAATAAAEVPWSGLRAGVGIADATWHVGAGSGQYGSTADPTNPLSPGQFGTLKAPSWGIQSRLQVRAIVLEDTEGDRVALVKSDNYLAQDYLSRRVGQLLDEAGSSITYDDIVHSASHNHSSPYYASPSAGVWLFQDVVDLRFFEYQARAFRDAILAAEADLTPARLGAAVVQHELFKGNITRSQQGHDGSPTGFAWDHGDKDLTVLRIDDMSDPSRPAPKAVWMNWGQHPESLDSYDLISADYLAPLQRFVDEATGATLVFSQGDVGSAEGPYDGWNRGRLPDGTLVAWAHTGYAQAERGARLLADDVINAFDAIGATGGDVGWLTDPDIDLINGWVPGPLSHPYPSASACNTDPTLQGDPGVLGPADCMRGGFDSPVPMVTDNLTVHGLPVPANYTLPAGGVAEENFRIHLQAVKLGPILLASCSCEAQVDLIRNLKSRANDVTGDQEDGWDWLDDPHTTCAEADGTWNCSYNHPGVGQRDWTFSQAAWDRWQAQVHNPADGWDDLANQPTANGDPADPADILGNFSSEELDGNSGFPLVVGLGHTGDYNGYTVSYREYMAYDHYRKTLTAYGPHTADWMVTWLVRMARTLNDPGHDWTAELAATDPTAAARLLVDETRQEATATALGLASSAAYEAWMATLADDAGPIEALGQPSSISRFDGTVFTWRGGSNAVDQPTARLERRVNGTWQAYAGMGGEVQVTLDLPDGIQGVAEAATGTAEWIWHANAEAFTGGPDTDLENTPPGTYRFVVDGNTLAGGQIEDYHLESDSFEVSVWDGVPAGRLSFDPSTGIATLTPDPVTYPRSYDSPIRFIEDDGKGLLIDPETGKDPLNVCETCAFRPWAWEGQLASATLTVTGADGRSRTVPMRPAPGGTFTAGGLGTRPGDRLSVAAGGARDQAANTNGQPSNVVVVAGEVAGTGRDLPATGGGFALAGLGLIALASRRRRVFELWRP